MKIIYFLMSNSTLFKSPAIYTFVLISLLVVLAVSAVNQTRHRLARDKKVSRDEEKIPEQNNREQKQEQFNRTRNSDEKCLFGSQSLAIQTSRGT